MYQTWFANNTVPQFSQTYREELLTIVGTNAAIQLLESASAIWGIRHKADLIDMRKRVQRLQKKSGVRLSPGKRTHPELEELEELVEWIAPLLLYLGLPLRCGETSKIVVALRLVGDALDVRGDPRDELRKQRRLQRQYHQNVKLFADPPLARDLPIEGPETDLRTAWKGMPAETREEIQSAVRRGLASLRITPP